jgi:hypothetical protein
MATTRIKKLGGVFSDDSFKKFVKQLNGRAILVVAMINSHCEGCQKILKSIQQLENGFIDKMPQLFLIYGFSEGEVISPDDEKREKSPPPKKEEEKSDKKGDKKVLGDSRFLFWDRMPEKHGYAIFLSETDVLYYNKGVDHGEFMSNIVDNLRRFKSSIRTLQGLAGKRDFLKKKRTGIIIETNGATQQSNIVSVEEFVKEQAGRIKLPVYFCKGLAQEISLVKSGEVVYKQKGLKMDKFLRKLPKFF